MEHIEKPILLTVNEIFNSKEVRPNEYSPLALAFIGDSVFDLVIKSVIVEKANCQVNKLQNKTSKIVRATTQALIVDALKDELSEEEANIYRRGRNAKPYTKAKNASYSEYCKATGLEALVGYLYLKGDTERLIALIKTGLENAEITI
ncbi:MAG: ribonuclease III domain-containing protein [Lachnospiraceae bacterium]|nr:ribonuclease III [Lachnospiraceae bacterium]MDD6580472.1 ribonuclease III domain-containing protein [Lachnospiraceae bacterium]MDY5217132.1 ribonuclease III domain-containing protein [Lachnospiraceae bacterium]MDY5640839.1 ribonuclease III domain-containing protein [Lachnospiraceae bacterium]